VIAPGATLTVAQLLALAERHTPTAAVLAANQRAAAAQVTQAGAWDNPEAEVEFGRAKTTDGERLGVGRLSVRQRIPWPGKRSSRIDAAQAGSAVTDSEARNFSLELAGEISANAIDFAIDHQGLDQAKAIQALANEVAALVQKRLTAGEATKSDVLRARVDALQADQEVASLTSDLAAARASLNALCGGVLPDTFTVVLALDQLPAIDHEQALAAAERQHPELARIQASLRQHQLEVERERSAAYPDVTVGLFGGKETDSRNVGVSLGVDLPLWNRNQGGIEGANAEVDRAHAELAVQRAKLRREVDQAWRDYEKARVLVDHYRNDIRSTAQEALRLAINAYQSGETSALDVLDARRTAQGIETSYIDALRQAHAARVRLDLATGALAPTTTPTSRTPAGTTP
jgi:cobalt-zinc-cadmium efflux system outer membrane protein